MSAIGGEMGRGTEQTSVIGRAFISPVFDLLVIGGVLSVVVGGALITLRGFTGERISEDITVALMLAVTSAHFAASTVRLYSKPGSFQNLPIMTMVFPALSFVVVGIALMAPDLVGRNLYLLYLSWSPYHYAAQSFGLSSMYAARSGVPLAGGERRLLWWTCMLPFAFSFLSGQRSGLGWLLTPAFFADHLWLIELRNGVSFVLAAAIFIVPIILFVWVRRRTGRMLPLIVLSLLFSNGVWWVAFQYYQAFFWATVFHGLQYLAIVLVFHLRDHPPARTGKTAWAWPALKFYGACLVLGYLLFDVWPYFFTWFGFAFTESVLICLAVINIHHFVVDRGIWQIRKDPGNRQAAQT